MPRWLPALLAVSLVLVALVAARPVLVPVPNPRLSRENFDRVKEGMKRVDVEAILGPPGDYRTGPTDHDLEVDNEDLGFYPPAISLVVKGRSETSQEWYGDRAIIRVCVDGGGTVTRIQFQPVKPEPVGLFELLRWRWDRWRESRR
jgi:hypothetical protein